VYSLLSTVEKVYLDRVYLYDDDGYQLGRLTHGQFLQRHDFPEKAYKPSWFTLIENDSTGNLQVQVGPDAPDRVYVVKYHYKMMPDPMDGDADPVLSESLLELVACGAMIRAYELPEWAGSGMRESQKTKFNRMLAEKIRRHRRLGPRGVQPRPFGGPWRGRYPFNLPVESD
jgi:hypothetical protein